MEWDANWRVDSFKNVVVPHDGGDGDDDDDDNLLSLRFKSKEELVSTQSLLLTSKQLNIFHWL